MIKSVKGWKLNKKGSSNYVTWKLEYEYTRTDTLHKYISLFLYNYDIHFLLMAFTGIWLNGCEKIRDVEPKVCICQPIYIVLHVYKNIRHQKKGT